MSRWRALHSCTRGCRSTQARRFSTMSNRKITACPAVTAWKSRVCACMCIGEEGDIEWRITFNTFMQGIYNDIPETNHLSRVAVLRLQFLVHKMPYPLIKVLCLYSTALSEYLSSAQYGCFRYFIIIIIVIIIISSSSSLMELLFLLLLLLLLRLVSRL